MMPSAMRSFAETAPSRPNAEAGTIQGSDAAAAVAVVWRKKFRREVVFSWSMSLAFCLRCVDSCCFTRFDQQVQSDAIRSRTARHAR